MKCPFCENEAEAEHVDIGVGFQQVEPWGCQRCQAYETVSQAEYDELVAAGGEGHPKSGWVRVVTPPLGED